MRTKHQGYNATVLFIIGLTIALGACSKQAWYEGAKSSQTAHCMNEPVSEYKNCIQQRTGNYDEYSETRERILKEKLKN